jgi:hypothetical protein
MPDEHQGGAPTPRDPAHREQRRQPGHPEERQARQVDREQRHPRGLRTPPDRARGRTRGMRRPGTPFPTQGGSLAKEVWLAAVVRPSWRAQQPTSDLALLVALARRRRSALGLYRAKTLCWGL